MLVRWAYNPNHEKVGTEEYLDDELARTMIRDGWAARVADVEAPPVPPPGEPDEAESA